MTSAEMDTRLSQLLADPNGNHWTQATDRIPSINDAQLDLVMRLLSFGDMYSHIYNIFAGIQKKEVQSVGSAGFLLSSLSETFLQNGFVNSSVILDSKEKFPVRLPIDKLGLKQNRFFGGNNRSPKFYIFEDTYFLLVDVGSFPVSTTFYYIRKPKDIAISPVQNSEFNEILHNMVVKMAMVRCFSMRSEQKDLARIQQLENEIEKGILSLARGAKTEPQTSTVGQYLREQKEAIQKQGEVKQS